MEELETKFEKLLIKTGDSELINAYADLKLEINKVLMGASETMELIIKNK